MALVNLFPAVALSMSKVPVLKELVRAVSFDPSLKAAVEHDYYQVIGKSQTKGEVTVAVDYMILDARHISLFFRVNAPIKEGSYDINLKDLKGNELPVASIYDTSYEIGKMEEINIDYTDEDTVPDEFVFNVTVNQNKEYKDNQEASVEVSETSPTPTVTANPESTGKSYNFSFRLKPDSRFTHNINSINIDKWIAINNQRIHLKSLEIYPTRARLTIDCDKNNSAILHNLDISFKDNNGTEYKTISNDVSATLDNLSQNLNSLYYESSYFAEGKHFTMNIQSIGLIDRDKQYGRIDYSKRNITNLPEGITVDSMTLTGNDLNVILKVSTGTKNNYQQIISLEYYDLDNKEYSLGSCDTCTSSNKSTYTVMFKIPNYKDHKYKVKWDYAPKQTLDKPIRINLK